MTGAETDDPPALTTIQDFWNRTTEQQRQPLPFHFECDVTFYDEEWGALWVQDETSSAYIARGTKPFPAHSGQRIRATGVFPPGTTALSFADAQIEVIGPAVMAPIPVSDGIDRFNMLRDRWIEVTGYVDRQETTSPVPSHLHLYFSINGRAVWGWMLLPEGEPPPHLVGSIVRVRAVYVPKFTPDRRLASVELMIPGPAELEVVSELRTDPRFRRPAMPIGDLASVSPKELVRVVGRVVAQEPGRYLRIRDDSGQVDLVTAQTRLCPVNEWVEAIGYPLISGTDWRVDDALFRPLASGTKPVPVPLDGAGRERTIRVAAAVLDLPAEMVNRARPVELEGVITWWHPESDCFYLQDASGGICVYRGSTVVDVARVGLNVEVRGVTGMGGYSPVVIAKEVEALGDTMLPQSRPIPLERALSGVEEAQWVEMRGYVRGIEPGEKWTRLDVTTAVGDFLAELPAGDDVSAYLGAVVRLYGVCTALADKDRRLEGILLRVPSSVYIQIEEAAPKDVFNNLPTWAISSIGQFGTERSLSRRVKVSGQVLDFTPGHGLYLHEGDDTLYVGTRETRPLEPGDIVEVVGIPGRQGWRPTLREAVYRKIGHGVEPAPKQVPDLRVPDRHLDGELVEIDAKLTTPPVFRDGLHLTLEAGGAVFEALLISGRPDTEVEARWKPGSELRLRGVYEVISDEYAEPRAFRLRLRGPVDVVVLHQPPWLTVRVVIVFASVLGLGTLVVVVWVVALRRRVRRQTDQIRAQLQREARLEAELQRTSKLESLGILAGGIAHDFNNLLTVVMGNVSLAQLDEGLQPESAEELREVERAVVRARDLTQQLLTFAKGGAPIRAAVALADVVQEVARFATHGANVRCGFSIDPALWPADVDKGQVSQVVQNIVINAVQAMPDGGVLRIGLRNVRIGDEMRPSLEPGRYVELKLADEGTGISPENLERVFDPYFSTKKQGIGLGLATVHSIIKRHRGHISVDSTIGVGTTFTIWLPAAEQEPVPASVRASPAVMAGRRVLFMDDEESICRMGAKSLTRAGLDVECVADGAAAVEAYRRARGDGRPFDVVILDLTVPGGMGGRQALEQLARIDPDVRAIVSSGYSSDPVLANHQAHGFRGMVSKPYEASDLLHAVQLVLREEGA